MREKLTRAKYQSDAEFIADGLLVFQNCQQYNMEDSDEYAAGVVLSKHFRQRAQQLGLEVEAEEPIKGRSSKRNSAGGKRKRSSL